MPSFDTLAISNPTHLTFGYAPKPVRTRSGMVIGGGIVYPEINFTLPSMIVNLETMPEVIRQYREMIVGVLTRASELEAPGVVVEFESLPPMTQNPEWGLEIVRILLDAMHEAEVKKRTEISLTHDP